MAQLGIDLSDYEAQTSFDPIPAGQYPVTVVDSDLVRTQTGKDMLKLTFEVDNGDYEGRKVFENFVLENDVALKRLKSLAVAVGHPNPNMIQDSEELHGMACVARVGIEIDKTGKYAPKNVIKGFKPLGGDNGVPAPAQPTPAPAPAAKKSSTPWKK